MIDPLTQTCPRCEELYKIVRRNPEVSVDDPLAQRFTLGVKCKCFGKVYHTSKRREIYGDSHDIVENIIKQLDDDWDKRYGPPQHGKTRSEWIKFMWRFEHGNT